MSLPTCHSGWPNALPGYLRLHEVATPQSTLLLQRELQCKVVLRRVSLSADSGKVRRKFRRNTGFSHEIAARTSFHSERPVG